MSPIHGRAPLVLVALVGLAACGGSPGANAIPDGGIVAACETPIPVQSVPGTPCSYPIPAPPCDVVDRAHIGVLVDGVEIPRDTAHTNGWDYADAMFTDVDIHGPSCDALTSGAATTVTIVYRILI